MPTAKDALEGAKALGRAIHSPDETALEHDLRVEAEKAKPEETTALVVTTPGQPIELSKGWSTEQVQLVKDTIAKSADLTDNEFLLFIATCQRMQLDPLARQIHAVKRGGKLSIQVGIDGFRAIADRTGKLAGNDDPVFEKHSAAKPELADYPQKATVTVHKLVAGEPRPFRASARWAEYYPGKGGPGFMYRKMPYLMLGKCAEALALRKAFPAELGGVYVPEEMAQARQGETSAPPENGPQESTWTPPTGTMEQLRKIGAAEIIPIGNEGTKGRPLGDLSQEHVDRLAKWVAARDQDFAVKFAPFVWAIDQLRTKTDEELEIEREFREVRDKNLARLKSDEPREPGEESPDEGGYQ